MTYSFFSLRKLVGALSVVWVLSAMTAPALPGQQSTETKIKLMADALRARDRGDLEAALRNLTQLSDLAPGDPAVKRLLISVQQDLDSERARINREATPAGVESTPAPAPAVVAVPAAVGSAPAETVASWPASPAPVHASRDAEVTKAPAAPKVDEAAAMEAEIAAMAKAEETRQRELVDTAKAQLRTARGLARNGRFDAAVATLDSAIRSLPENPMTQAAIKELAEERTDTLLAQAQAEFRDGNLVAARVALSDYEANGASSRESERLARKLAEAENPVAPTGQRPEPVVTFDAPLAPSAAERLWAEARNNYAAGRWDDADAALNELQAIDPQHGGARRLAARIADERIERASKPRAATRAELIEEVGLAWSRPEVAAEPVNDGAALGAGGNPLLQKLNAIRIPSVSFSAVELHRVVSTLSDLSREFDGENAGGGGVNILVIDPQNRRPTVSLTLRDLSLKRVLDFITDSIGYQYEVQADAIVVRPGGETSTLDTEFFPITRSTVIRMTGIGGGVASGGSTVSNDPFSPSPSGGGGATPGGGSEAQALKMFLQQAGVDFESTVGASLAYDGSAMIVTQTSRNVERIRNILNRYNDVRQVEIEAKFMEVQEGALEELGVKWSVNHGINGDPNYYASGGTQNRTLTQAFSPNVGGTSGRITSADIPTTDPTTGLVNGILQKGLDVPIANNPPNFPGSVDLADGAGSLANIQAMIGEFNVNAVIQALSRQSGSDLLSAPKVTVLSGNPANITVAQELRFPTSYGEIRSEVGSSSRDSSSAGVTITAGTPRDFETRKVGVELRVTPTVEEDDYSISLDLNPKVTEFEGFVEYGGQSVAISNGTTVNVPSGFYQPIFSTREVSTKVTLWDGATLVMGGLTREEVKTVHDKVPFLGSIPGLGRLFRSTGETTQKRNLLIFVTANLVSPGGSPKKQAVKGVAPSSAYQNPVLVTPGGAAKRN